MFFPPADDAKIAVLIDTDTGTGTVCFLEDHESHSSHDQNFTTAMPRTVAVVKPQETLPNRFIAVSTFALIEFSLIPRCATASSLRRQICDTARVYNFAIIMRNIVEN